MVWYIPKANAITEQSTQLSLIEQNPLGLLISSQSSYLSTQSSVEVSHLPFIVIERDDKLFLLTHLAKKNDQIQQLSTGNEVSVIFREDNHSYVSASWYPRKKIDHKIVSTWDYCAVHIKGIPTVITSHDGVLSIVTQITNSQESKRNIPDSEKWKVEDAPTNYIDALLTNIVGLEIEITEMKGKFKLNQNHSKDEINALTTKYKEEIGGELGDSMAEMTLKHFPK